MSVDLATLLRISTRLPVETSRIFNFIKDVVFMQASRFPWINILWMGCILMAVGFIWSLVKRARHKNNH